MNINTNYSSLNIGTHNSMKIPSRKVTMQNMQFAQNKIENKMFSDEAVKVELGVLEEGHKYTNTLTSWHINGEQLYRNEIDDETMSHLKAFMKTRVEYSSSRSFSEFRYGELMVEVGNKYSEEKGKLTEKYSGDELKDEIDKLDNAFQMYVETRIVGSGEGDLGSIAHSMRIKKIKMEHEKQRELAMQELHKTGMYQGSSEGYSLPKDKKQTLSDILENSKKVMAKVVQYFLNGGSAIKSDEDLKNLNEQTGLENGWSLSKVSTTFDLLENLIGRTPADEKYTDAEYKSIIESEYFSEEEISLFEFI